MIISRRACDLPEPPAGPDPVALQRRHDAEEATLVRFGLDGAEFEIDLCGPHRLEFASMSDYWAEQGRRPPRNGPGRTADRRRRAASMRSWARELPADRLHELTGETIVSPRGRLSRAIERAYEAEHA